MPQQFSAPSDLESGLAIVIPAGGGGTRLWPRSRQATPKQFLDVVSARTMLQETTDRVEDLVSPDRVFVITNAKHVQPVREQLPDVPAANIIGEPIGRDSPAIGLMAAILERRLGADAVMAVLPADHVILDSALFRDVLRVATQAAQAGYLVTVGIPPTTPDTGFGYIQSTEIISGLGTSEISVRGVQQFREKPKHEVAVQYLEAGGYFWNAGMFIATVGRLRDLYRAYLPQMEAGFRTIVDALESDNAGSVLAEVFPTLDKISFDYAIAEKADSVAVIPAEIGWNDVGSWARLAEVLTEAGTESLDGRSESANIVVGNHIGIDTTGSMIYSPYRLIATIGMEDFIVIDTPDALLICPKSRSEDVKQVVDALKGRGDHHLL